MKVAFLIVKLGPGGAPTYIIRLAEQFSQQGIEVNIISLLCSDSAHNMMRNREIPWQCLGMRNPYDLSVLKSIISVLRDLQPQIVHTNHPLDAMLGNLAARIIGVPCITTFHGTLDHYYLPKTTKRSRFLSYLRHLWAERLAAKLATRSIANSNVVKEDLVKHRICPSSKINVIHHGVDLREFDPTRFPISTADRFTVGCISRIAPEKGIRYFIEAATIISQHPPNVQFMLIGEAKSNVEQKYLEKHLKSLDSSANKISFKLLGHRTDIPFLLSQMDVVVIPSLSEGFGLVAIEAMAMGKPVVASNVGGLPEVIVDGETGLLVPPGNAEAIAKAVEHLLKDTCLRETMRQKARIQVEKHFSQKRMVEQTLRCYETVIS